MRDAVIRASDEDRDRAAQTLRDHAIAGRLTTEELDERSGRVFAARTLADLDDLFFDLPRADRRPARARAVPPSRSVAPSRAVGAVLVQGILWTFAGLAIVTLAVLCAVVWLVARLARLAVAAANTRALRPGRAEALPR